MLPLEGLRVVELTTAWAGPMAGRVLGWFGAEPVHVESPNRVDTWRSNRDAPNPPTYPGLDPGDRPFDRAFTFNSQNVNKLSLVIDLKHPPALDAVRAMLAGTDVLICNFRPGMLARLGLDRDTLARDNPGIIVVEMPAFGLTGPHASYAALGPTMEMAAGMSAQIAYPGGTPTVTGPSYMDPIGGFNAAAATLTALYHRMRTGEGQQAEVGQVEAAMQFIGPELMAGADPEPDGNHVDWCAPHNAYPALGTDNWLVIAAETEAQWQVLAGLAGLDDARFATLAGRKAAEADLDAALARWTAPQDKHALAARLQALGVAAAPVMTPRDLAASPYLAARGFFTELTHPVAGRHPYIGLPFHAEETQGGARKAAPGFGEDNHWVLANLAGLSETAIEALEEAGALSTRPPLGV